MTLHHYVGIAEPGPGNWSISFPAFPGVVTVGDAFGDAFAHAQNTLASAIEAMREDGEAIRADFTVTPEAFDYDPAEYANPRIIVVSSKALRINVTMDEALLSRLDLLARRTHATRSALLAQGARLILADTSSD